MLIDAGQGSTLDGGLSAISPTGAGALHVAVTVCLRSDEELLPGRSLDVDMERIGPEHAGE